MTDTKTGPGALDTSVAGVSTSLPKESAHSHPGLLYSLGQLEDFVARLAQIQAPPGLPELEADVRAAVAASRDPALVERLEHVRAAASLLGQKLEPLMDAGGHSDPEARWDQLVLEAWSQLKDADACHIWIHDDIARSVAEGIVGAPEDVELAVQIALERLEMRIGEVPEDVFEWLSGLTRSLIPFPARPRGPQ